MKRIFKIGSGVRVSREKNMLGKNCLFADLYGNSSAMLGQDTPATRKRLVKQLRELADALDDDKQSIRQRREIDAYFARKD